MATNGHIKIRIEPMDGGLPLPAHTIPDGDLFEMTIPIDTQYVITLKKMLSLMSRGNDMNYIRDSIHDQFEVE